MSMVTLPGLRDMIDNISRERNLPKSAVQAALREALLKGYERYRRTQRLEGHFDEEYFLNFEVELDIEEEGFRVLASKTIVEEVTNPDHEIALREVQEVAAEAQPGDTVVLDVTPDQGEFGRMAAIQTKQVLAQKLRDQQRKIIQEEFQDLEGTVLQARVLRFERQSVIMAISSGFGNPEVEAELPKKEQLPNDKYRSNATYKVYLKRVLEGSHRGPQLIVSRADAGLVVYLFANEVPEIEDEVVRIVAVAREANPPSRQVGPRTKIAVDTLERDVDPVGACIGARGSRIQAVVNELQGEKIDVIRWSPDPATYISNALSPARVDEVRLVDPEERQAHVLVSEDQLSLAIGKEGQNVRLAARLTGWKIDIKDSAKYDYAAEDQKIADIIEQRRQAQQEELEAENEEDFDFEDEEFTEEEELETAAVDSSAEQDLDDEIEANESEADEIDEDEIDEDEIDEDYKADGSGTASSAAFERP
ncbi:MAG TPA: transcription termination factor NusA [Leptolyngbyaceae cyanobacterium M33_DOE_097]|uniref:Transcription termination/antitermination protein NusA n=1 Tax=Oscillatoriales cyanobacterium SpSt-418 TaxID=2282169 RepID=A0A7C3KDG3_9CYAN|nr:transcription termination factor NusA [Leptolyngbyaceae cyanobacterium M33_DOE_097]